MTYIIYPDVMLLWNSLINMIVLLAASLLINYKTRISRKIIFSFAAGGLMTLEFICTYPLNRYIHHIFYVLIYMIMIKIYFREKSLLRFLIEIIVTVLILILLNGTLNIFFKGHIDNELSSMFIILPVILLILLLSIGIKNLSEDLSNQYDISFRIGEKEYRCRAYYDTGNSLTDPYNGYPVVIMDYSFLKKILDKKKQYIEQYHNTGFFDYTVMSRDCQMCFYPLAYKTISTGMSIMPAFKIESFCFRGEDKRIENVICGVSRFRFAGNRNYEILLNRNIKPDRKEKFK